MTDITPDLLESIRKDYNKRFGTSATIRALSRKIDNNTATYSDAFRYAKEVGNIRAKTLKSVISSDKLPDGKMYYNIAKQVVNDSLKTDYKAVNKYCESAQKNKNKKMKIGVSPANNEIDQENIDSIIDMVSAKDSYDDVSAMFEMACSTFAKHVVDRSMQSNAKFHQRLGLKVSIVRTSESGCCPWCSDISGSFTIGNAPDDIWGRHNDCNCTIDYESH